MTNISIITYCSNDLDELISTCKSIDEQVKKPYEHWIINCSSGTQIDEWLNETKQPMFRKWMKLNDVGLMKAINTGIQYCEGNIIHILHSGDYLINNYVLEDISNEFEKDDALKWVSGKLKLITKDKNLQIGKAFIKKYLHKGIEGVYQQTWFVRKEIYERVGLYNEKYIYSKEYDMLCRISEEKYKYINKALVCYLDLGFTKNQYHDYLNENLVIYESYFGRSIKARVWRLVEKLKSKFI